VFSRQLIAHAQPADIALGISTSGNSRNLLVAFEEAHRRGLLTIGLALFIDFVLVLAQRMLTPWTRAA